MKRILVVAGTRPEIIKLAPVIRELKKTGKAQVLFVLSGQHYDYEMSMAFVKDLELPRPDAVLKTGSAPDPVQLGVLTKKLAEFLHDHDVDLVVGQGDTNTALAAALASTKSGVPFAHVEAGLRNFDRRMPEELNRMLIADLAEVNFAPTVRSAENLICEGVPPDRIEVVGNTVVDSVLWGAKAARERSDVLERLGLEEGGYVLATVHRVETADDRVKLGAVMGALSELSKEMKVVIPLHPRTRRNLSRFGLLRLLRGGDILLVPPLGYLDFVRLLLGCKLVLTDSGGVQEEALTLGKPCLTLRRSTERPETVEAGGNRVTGLNGGDILASARRAMKKRMVARPNPLGDGRSGERVARAILRRLEGGGWFESPSYLREGAPRRRAIVVDGDLAGRSVGEMERELKCRAMAVFDGSGRFAMPAADLVLRKGDVLITLG